MNFMSFVKKKKQI